MTADTTTLTYTNPTLYRLIEDWPSGKFKTRAEFKIEQNSKGERATRTTVNPKTGRPNAPKLMTYARKSRIVDGSDGKLYIINLAQHFPMISVMMGTFDYGFETIHKEDSRYQELLALFND